MLVGNAENLDLVFALDLVAGMGQPRGEIAITRQQQQPLGVVVEPTDGIDVVAHPPFSSRSITVGRSLRIRTAGDVAARLVQKKVQAARGGLEAPTVDADVVGVRIGLRCRAR